MSSPQPEKPDRGIETHVSQQPLIRVFYYLVAALLLTLTIGLARSQLVKSEEYADIERIQNQRRVLIPGPRGNIYDRDGKILVRNRPRFAVTVNLDELRPQFHEEAKRIREAYHQTGDDGALTGPALLVLARYAAVQRQLDTVARLLGRKAAVDSEELKQHFRQKLLLPFVLLDDLSENEFSVLLEQLPVNSPLQLYTSTTRDYPYGSAAAHVLGFVSQHDLKTNEPAEAASAETELPEEQLRTFAMKGTVGRDGLERQFDSRLQGETGTVVYRVDPAGFRVNPAVYRVLPRQGGDITTSLDIDLQLTAEKALEEAENAGAAVALDVATGEVLVMASKPDFDLNKTSPRISTDTWKDISARGAFLNRCIAGSYPPGSTFKILVTIAGLRSGQLMPDDTSVDCEGITYIGKSKKTCENGLVSHGHIDLVHAIAQSCDIYFYRHGIDLGPRLIAQEARRFHLDQRTGIELPGETGYLVMPDPEWKKKHRPDEGSWSDGDTANMAIGQGFVLVSPLDMACFAASVARNEVYTKPTLIHRPDAPAQHSESIGLTPTQRAVLLKGMEGCTQFGTASNLTKIPNLRIPGVQLAGKTGTAQKTVRKDGVTGTINYAWFICFAPAEKPEIAMAVLLEGDTIGENYGGGSNSGPIAAKVVKRWWEKKRGVAAGVAQNEKAGAGVR